MVYLKKFILPTLEQEVYKNDFPNEYPYGIFPFKQLTDVSFLPITIFYGGNGSGKSTLLNLIAERLHVPRTTLFNTSPMFNYYTNTLCAHENGVDDEGLKQDIPIGSKIITSEDVFNHILSVRFENVKIDKRKLIETEKYLDARFGSVRFNSLKDLEKIKKQNEARGKTVTSFIRDYAGTNINQFSNGETALSFFDLQFRPNKLYLLDEPENSLSPKFQLQLSKLILDCAYYCGCQFIIATHSPIILAIADALIYNLDSSPAKCEKWYELENVRMYYDFFKEHQSEFEKD